MLADHAAGWLFYAAVGSAAVTAVAWWAAAGLDAQIVQRSVTVLVIACPHALGLAVPLVVAITTSLAARDGMLIRDRIAAERARELDVVLVQNDPLDVVSLVRLSRASYRKMQQNLVWAAGYNVFAIPQAAGVLAPIGILLSPAVGAMLMSASTVIVAVNAQLLRGVSLKT